MSTISMPMANNKFSFVATAMLLLLSALASTICAEESINYDLSDDGWQSFKGRYGKNYEDPTEDSLRCFVFVNVCLFTAPLISCDNDESKA